MHSLLINERGQPRFGIHAEPIAAVNHMDYDLRSTMDRKRSRFARRMGFNQFQFIGLMGPDWCGGIAIVDLKWLSVAFFYLYDFERRQLLERSLQVPLALGTRIDDRPDHGDARFRRGTTRLRINAEPGGRRVELSAGAGIEAQFRLTGPGADFPLRVCSPAGYNRWSYTQKWAGLELTGEWRWGDRVYRCTPQHRGSVDWSCGFMRRETSWNWACLAGAAASGESVGLNLATGINESGVSENALWVDGKLQLLGQSQFEFDRYQHDAPWRVTTRDGRIDLSFEPAGHRAEKVNAWLIASNFRQFYGSFSGSVTTEDGRRLDVSGLRGFMEDHYARW